MVSHGRFPRWLALVLALLPFTARAGLVNITTSKTTPLNVEIDVIFPRNDTYAHADAFPVIFAIQNNAPALRLGNYVLSWLIRPYSSAGNESWIEYMKYETNSPAYNPPLAQDPLLVINQTTTLAKSINPANRAYELVWNFSWYVRCQANGNQWDVNSTQPMVTDRLIFTIQEGTTKPEITAGSQCPELGSLIGVAQNLSHPGDFGVNDYCPVLGDTGFEANPCAAKVDAAIAKTISSVLGTMPTPTRSTTSMSSGASPTSTPSNGAFFAPAPVRRAIGAASWAGVLAMAL